MKNIKSILFLTALLTICSGYPNPSEAIVFDNIYDRTELLSSLCIGQDSEGTIWFGTDKYLYSYDGYELNAHTDGIGHIQINSLAILDESIILGCNEGLYIYNIDSEKFEKLDYFNNDAIKVIEIKNDTLFVGSQSGTYVYNMGETSSPTSIKRLSTEEVLSMLICNDRLWIGTVKGLREISFNDFKYRDIPLNLSDKSLSPTVITAIYQDDNSTLWLGTPNSLLKTEIATYNTTKKLSVPVLKSLCKDDNGSFIVGTDSGLFLYNPLSGESDILKDGVIMSDFTVDKDGNIWLATNNGLLIARQNRIFQNIRIDSKQVNTPYTCMLKDTKGRLWAGSANGLLLFEKNNAEKYAFVRYYSMNKGQFFIPHNKVKKIVEDRHNGTIYIATDGGYLKYNEADMQFERLGIPGTYNWYYDIIIDGNRIWLASYEGLFCVIKGEIKYRFSTSDGLSTNDIAQIAKDRSGNIWILTRDQNIYILDIKKKEIKRFDIEDYANGNYPDCIISDLEGDIWISAKNELININASDGYNSIRTTVLDTHKSLDVYSMNDILGKILVCSSEGVIILDKQSGKIGHINTKIPYVSICYDAVESNIILGTLGTLAYFPSKEIDKLAGNEEHPVSITSITVNGTKELSRSEIKSKDITLGSKQNNLNITFSDFNYSNEINNRFQFSLTSKKSNWNEVITGNTIMLTDIKPGRYKLYISSGNNTEKSSEAISIRVRKPWYLSFMMLSVYFLTACAFVFWVIRFLTLKRYLILEREQRTILLEQSKQKENFFSNIAHEFKTPLSLIIAPLSKLIMDTDINDKDAKLLKTAYDNAAKLNSMIHHTIDYYNDNNHISNNPIRSEVEFVEFAKTLFFSYKDGYPNDEFIFNSSKPEIIVDVDITKMETVINNLMSNACKYTPEGGSVMMFLEYDDKNEQLVIKVSDTGIGIPNDELSLVFQRYYESSRTKHGQYDSTGIGLSVIKNNVESHGGNVCADSDEHGTTFTVIIPCKETHKTTEANKQNSAAKNESNKPLIVIVDDNDQIRDFLKSVLSDKYRCVSSNNGKSGLKLCKDIMPDLIISDAVMPIMDGLEMCRLIREFTPLASIPIILLTAKSDKTTEMKSIDLNIDSFIAKPFDLSTLTARIDQLIGNKRRMEQKLRMEIISTPKETHELSCDEKYINNVTQIIEEHLDDTELSVKSLCTIGDFNEKQLYRKIKQFTGLSTIEYIRTIRLRKAAFLLQNGNFTISEVMYSVGFSNASYFTRAFSAEFGKTPSEYLKFHKQTK